MLASRVAVCVVALLLFNGCSTKSGDAASEAPSASDFAPVSDVLAEQPNLAAHVYFNRLLNPGLALRAKERVSARCLDGWDQGEEVDRLSAATGYENGDLIGIRSVTVIGRTEQRATVRLEGKGGSMDSTWILDERDGHWKVDTCA